MGNGTPPHPRAVLSVATRKRPIPVAINTPLAIDRLQARLSTAAVSYPTLNRFLGHVQPHEVVAIRYRLAHKRKDDGTTTSRTFVHTPSTIEAEEAEEIGVEHLLRDIRDVAVGTLSTRITSQLQSLQGLHLRLRDIGQYLQKVLDHELPVNHAILGNLQDVFNLLPNLSTPATTPRAGGEPEQPTDNAELARAMSIKTNDQLMAIYLSSLVRAVTAYHDLIENKIQNRQQQEENEQKREQEANTAKNEKEGAKKANGTATEQKEDQESKEKTKKR